MKRSPIQRKTPLRRTRMKRRPPRRLQRAGNDPVRRAWARQQPCCVRLLPNATPCWGPHDPSHIRNLDRPTGTGLKPSDEFIVTNCRGHHGEWEEYRGVFLGWPDDKRKAWARRELAFAQAAYERFRRAA